MPNVHMQTAAKNLMQAVSDLRLLQQQIRSDAEQKKKDFLQKISDRKKEKVLVTSDAINLDSDTAKSLKVTRMRSINQEVKDIEKLIYDIEDDTRKQIKSLEDQAVQVESMSRQLAGMA